MVVTLTSPRAGVGVGALTPGVVGGQTRAGRPELVHQAVHQLTEGVVDRGPGAGVHVAPDDDQVSAVAARVIVGKVQNLYRLVLSDRTVEGLEKRNQSLTVTDVRTFDYLLSVPTGQVGIYSSHFHPLPHPADDLLNLTQGRVTRLPGLAGRKY